MRFLVFTLVVLISMGTPAIAQVSDTTTSPATVALPTIKYDSLSIGTINIYQPKKLSSLIKSHRYYNNKKNNSLNKIVRGYRVQIASNNNRMEVLSVKSKFLSLYPNVRTYLVYQVPYYKLRVGEFVERKEAENFLRKVRRQFGECFIIREDLKIKTKKEKADKDKKEDD